jgi:hypothetical protein
MTELGAKLLAASLGWFENESRCSKRQYVTSIRPRVVLFVGILLGYLLAMIVMTIRSG